jgi:site-specific recombinase XerD
VQWMSNKPVMICADGKLLGSRTVIENMRAISSRHGADPKDVVVHSLKHAVLSALGSAGASSVDIATAGGHKTIESSVPYLHPDMDQGRRNSEILGRKRGLERSDV